MASKHFSHSHSLVFQQLPEASRFNCSGCKSPASGNAYACWQCTYFLHEKCFHASRSFKHPSHPPHPLTLVPFPTYPSGSFFCNSCSHPGDGFSYTCSACEFDIHVNCALFPNSNPNPNPNPNPNHNHNPNPNHNHNVSPYPIPAPNSSYQPKYPILPPHNPTIPNSTSNPPLPNNPFPTPPPLGYPQSNPPPPPAPTAAPPPPIKHFSHPHALNPIESDKNSQKLCSACDSKLHGPIYICAESQHCGFGLHKSCFDSPREIRHKSHPQHALTLLATPPYTKKTFTCDACWKDGGAFVYNCAACSYDLHVSCARLPETVTRPDHKHALVLQCAGQGPAFMCDACLNGVHESAWVYYCRECDFGTHVECVRAERRVQTHEERLQEIDDMRKEMEIRNAMSKLEADQRKFMLSLWD